MSNQKVNEHYNELREICKMPNTKDRGMRIVSYLEKLASYTAGMLNSTDDKEDIILLCNGFNSISILMGAVEPQSENEVKRVLSVISLIVALTVHAIEEKKNDN